MEKVVLIIKDHSLRGKLMAELRAFGISYVEAPDLREAFKRADEKWEYSLICYDPHGLGLENCHNYEVVVRATKDLRERCRFPKLCLLDECVTLKNWEQFTQKIAAHEEIGYICPLERAVSSIKGILDARSLAPALREIIQPSTGNGPNWG